MSLVGLDLCWHTALEREIRATYLSRFATSRGDHLGNARRRYRARFFSSFPPTTTLSRALPFRMSHSPTSSSYSDRYSQSDPNQNSTKRDFSSTFSQPGPGPDNVVPLPLSMFSSSCSSLVPLLFDLISTRDLRKRVRLQERSLTGCLLPSPSPSLTNP